MKGIILFLEKTFNASRTRYLVEYKIEDNIYNLVVRGRNEEQAIESFEDKWIETVGNMYPFPEYEIVSIRRFFNKIKVS